MTAFDNQTFDYTQRKDMKAGYTEKMTRYDDFGLELKVIPFVISRKYEMYLLSILRVKKYLNLRVLLAKFAIFLS